VAACLLLAGCGPARGAAKDKRIAIQFWHAMGGAEHATALNAFARDFERLNPDVHVIPVFQGNYGQLSQKLIASVIARNSPVMAQMYEGWTARFLERNLLDPVENYFGGADGLSPEEIEDVWEPFRRNNTWGGRMVTMPFNKSCYVLYVNQDMLRAAGCARPPETWAELREAARRLTVREGGKSTPKVYGFLMRAQIEAYSVLLFRAGENFLSPDGRQVVLDTPLALQALELLRGMIVEDQTAYTDNTSYPAIPFGAGKVAMYIHSSAAFPFNDTATRGKFTWIACPLPHPEGREGGILFQGTNIGIFARNHSPEERRAAWRFLKFITNTKNAARWSIDTGYVAVRKSSVETPEMQAFLKEHPNYRVPIALVPQATFDPRPSYWDEMRPQIATFALEAMNGQRSPADAIQVITRTLRQIIAYETR
jgi:multiple sugar transport system substrate-binding protein